MKNSTSRINRVLANENSQKQILHRIQLSLAVYQLDTGFIVKISLQNQSKSGNATRRLSISTNFADQLLESIDMLAGKWFDYFLTTKT